MTYYLINRPFQMQRLAEPGFISYNMRAEVVEKTKTTKSKTRDKSIYSEV